LYCQAREIIVTVRLKQVLSWWFILQIVLPFTAPLQTLDLHDLFGTKSTRSAQAPPESTTTPTISEASDAVAFVSALEPTTLAAGASLGTVAHLADGGPLTPAFNLPPSPQVQRSVLRV
jgi:hypothetical protein